MPVGRARRFPEAVLSPRMKAEHIKRTIEVNYHQSKLKIEVSAPQKNIYTLLANSKSPLPLGCSAGVTDLGLLPDGTLVDCPIHRYRLGYWEDLMHGNLSTLRDKKGLEIKTFEDEKRKGFRWSRIGHYIPIPCGGLHVNSTEEINELILKEKAIEEGRQKLIFKIE